MPSIGAPQLQQSILKDRQHVAPSDEEKVYTYVALVCGIKGLEGNDTGASISIDMVVLKTEEFLMSYWVDDRD